MYDFISIPTKQYYIPYCLIYYHSNFMHTYLNTVSQYVKIPVKILEMHYKNFDTILVWEIKKMAIMHTSYAKIFDFRSFRG